MYYMRIKSISTKSPEQKVFGPTPCLQKLPTELIWAYFSIKKNGRRRRVSDLVFRHKKVGTKILMRR